MKRRELVGKLEQMGCILVRHGGSHDWYTNPATKKSQPVPRHKEIHEELANHHPEAQQRMRAIVHRTHWYGARRRLFRLLHRFER